MKSQLDKLKHIHFAWFGLAGLWLLAFIFSLMSVSRPPAAPAYGYGPPPSHAAETLFIAAFIAYLAGGLVLGKIHNRHTAAFTNASYRATVDGEVTEFHITPARRHLPFWLFGLFGALFVFSVPYMLAGNAAGTYFTLLCAALFAFLGLQPKLWREPAAHAFSIGGGMLKTRERTIPLKEIVGLSIGPALRGKSDKAAAQNAAYYPVSQSTVFVTAGNPIAAHGMMAAAQIGAGASAAAGKGIAEIANRYFHEMRARSFRIEAVTGGRNLIVAEGLDAYTARALALKIEQLAAW